MSMIAFLANPAFWAGVGQAGAGASGVAQLGGMFGMGGDEGAGKFQTFSTLDPTQQNLMAGLGTFLEGKVGEGLPEWGGAFTAPLSGAEQIGGELLQKYIGGGVGETGAMGLGAFQEALQGMDPKAIHEQYMKYIAPSEAKYLKEVAIPSFKESMVPGGALRSTGTEKGISDIVSGFGTEQLGRIGEMIQSERAGARSMMPLVPGMAALEGGVPQMEAAFKFGDLPRMIEQAELSSKIQEFIRTTPELSPILDKVRSLLDVQTMGAYFE